MGIEGVRGKEGEMGEGRKVERDDQRGKQGEMRGGGHKCAC